MDYLFLKMFFYIVLLYLETATAFEGRNCTSTEECTTEIQKANVFCCGECGRSFCCSDRNLSLNATCDKQKDPDAGAVNNNNTIKMLGAIVGGMVGSFVFAMVGHMLIRKIIAKLRKRRSDEQTDENVHTEIQTPEEVEVLGSVNALPMYEDIHLYKIVDPKPEYSVDNECDSTPETKDKSEKDKAGVDEKLQPPPYQPSNEMNDYRCESPVPTISREVAACSSGEPETEVNQKEFDLDPQALAAIAKELGIEDQSEGALTAMIRLWKRLDSEDGRNKMRRLLDNESHKLSKSSTSSLSDE